MERFLLFDLIFYLRIIKIKFEEKESHQWDSNPRPRANNAKKKLLYENLVVILDSLNREDYNEKSRQSRRNLN